jgi:hypothetical protein
VISGVNAIQHNQVKLNGAKQAAYKSPLQIAASHGQKLLSVSIECIQRYLGRNIRALQKFQTFTARSFVILSDAKHPATSGLVEIQWIPKIFSELTFKESPQLLQ